MLRLDPGEGRIRTARSFHAWEGGGEYNVARGLRRASACAPRVVTALADNEVGRLRRGLRPAGRGRHGADPVGAVRRRRAHGPQRAQLHRARLRRARCRRGRPTAATRPPSQLRPGDVDWEHLFGALGVRWFHTGGIFAALSEHDAGRRRGGGGRGARHGTVVSYDLNYRPSLWKAVGGVERAREVNRGSRAHIDVMIGNEEDFTACLGLEVEGVDENLADLDTGSFRAMIERVAAEFPNFPSSRRRCARSGARRSTTGLRSPGRSETGFAEATPRPGLEILDRVGGGDSFASGLVYGLLGSATSVRRRVRRRPRSARDDDARATPRWRRWPRSRSSSGARAPGSSARPGRLSRPARARSAPRAAARLSSRSCRRRAR